MAVKLLERKKEYKRIKIEINGPSSYVAGGPTITVPNVNQIEDIESASITGGFLVSAADAQKNISGNSFKLPIYQFNYPATAAGPASEVAAGTDLSAQTIVVIVRAL